MADLLLNQLLVGQVYGFMVTFARIGTAFAFLPGFADSVVSMRVRLMLALAITAVLTPIVAPLLPPVPGSALALGMIVLSESFIGLFLGVVTRVMLSALETAGMIISIQTGMAAVMLFNPAMASQSSIIGVVLSTLGTVLLFITDLHHLLITAVADSYRLFAPAAAVPIADLNRVVIDLVGSSFAIGAEMAAPFLVVFLLLNAGLGVLQKLAPQIQIFFVTISVQLGLGLFMLVLVLSATMMFWLGHFEDTLIGFLRN